MPKNGFTNSILLKEEGLIERVAQEKPMLTLESTIHPIPKGSRLKKTTTGAAVSARVWIATSPTLDFRAAQWEIKSVSLMSSGATAHANLRGDRIKLIWNTHHLVIRPSLRLRYPAVLAVNDPVRVE